uniref:Uncharacterized protein n=1 Tax=Knipowitschia caucasica TaxID=637954 RepID=A0AAV2LJB1_KNICA
MPAGPQSTERDERERKPHAGGQMGGGKSFAGCKSASVAVYESVHPPGSGSSAGFVPMTISEHAAHQYTPGRLLISGATARWLLSAHVISTSIFSAPLTAIG